ncbi:MAG TPA: oligosaccharide flippase family protein [Puia sp.]|nr:oligosaccharide flippase family protein [Puia sp.]
MKNKLFSSYWLRSGFYSIMQRLSITLFGLVSYMLLARWGLPPSDMGVYAIFLIVITNFELAKSALLKNAHVKFMSMNEDGGEKTRIASSSLLINGSITLLFIVLILLFGGLLARLLHTGPALAVMLRWYIPGLVAMVIFSHLEATQQGHLDFKGGFAGYFARQVTFFALILVQMLTRHELRVTDVALFLSVSVIAGTIVLYAYTRKYLHHRWDYHGRWTKRLLGFGGYIFGSGVMSNIYQSLDQIMTAALLQSNVAVAEYNAAARINQFIDTPSYAAAEVLFPKAAQASEREGKEKVRYLFERMVAALLCFTIPTAIVISLVPRLVLRLISGPAYLVAAPILQLYMISGILRPAQNQAANLLNSIGKPGLAFWMNTAYLVVNLGTSYVCLMTIGFYGAAVGSIITFSLGAVAWTFVMKKQIGFRLGGVWRYMWEYGRIGYGFATRLFAK